MATTVINKNSIGYQFREVDFRNNCQIFFSARKGVSTKILFDFAKAIKMPDIDLASIINCSLRTLKNYRNKEQHLRPFHSEHLLKVMALYKRGEAIFGNIDQFNCWLNIPFWKIIDKPVDWLNTPCGLDIITEELEKIEQGYPL